MGICYTRLEDSAGVAAFTGAGPRLLAIRPWIDDELFASVVYRLHRAANDNV